MAVQLLTWVQQEVVLIFTNRLHGQGHIWSVIVKNKPLLARQGAHLQEAKVGLCSENHKSLQENPSATFPTAKEESTADLGVLGETPHLLKLQTVRVEQTWVCLPNFRMGEKIKAIHDISTNRANGLSLGASLHEISRRKLISETQQELTNRWLQILPPASRACVCACTDTVRPRGTDEPSGDELSLEMTQDRPASRFIAFSAP